MTGRWHTRLRLPEHLVTGLWGERLAAAFLKRKGLKVIGKRIRVGPKDELDIVARDDNTLIFVEVKTRKNSDFGRPASAVDRRKIQNLSRAAMGYVRRLRKKPSYVRFDIVEVLGQPGGMPPEINHIENAFQLSKKYRMDGLCDDS